MLQLVDCCDEQEHRKQYEHRQSALVANRAFQAFALAYLELAVF